MWLILLTLPFGRNPTCRHWRNTWLKRGCVTWYENDLQAEGRKSDGKVFQLFEVSSVIRRSVSWHKRLLHYGMLWSGRLILTFRRKLRLRTCVNVYNKIISTEIIFSVSVRPFGAESFFFPLLPNDIKTQIHKTITMLIPSCGCKTWSSRIKVPSQAEGVQEQDA